MDHLFTAFVVIAFLILTPFLIMISNSIKRREQEQIDAAFTAPRPNTPDSHQASAKFG